METQLFTIGEMNAAGFWAALITGAALSLFLGLCRARRAGISACSCGWFALLSVVLGVLCSHVGYCLMRLDYVLNEAGAQFFLTFDEGGYMMWGGIAGVVLAAFLSCRLQGRASLSLLDAAAPAGGLMIAAVRIAEGFAGQGYGEYIFDEGFFCVFPFAAYDPLFEAWAWLVFVPEALWALVCGLIVLFSRKEDRPGGQALLLTGLYAAAQIVFESLRRDEFLRWGFVRGSQLLSAAAVLAVLILFFLRVSKGFALRKTLCFAGYAAMITSVVLLEFATEKRIPFLTFLEIEGCYAAMAVCCLILMACIHGMRTIGFTHTARRNPSC